MFDDLDDDDVTDLIPDSEVEKKEKKRFREQEQQKQGMTVSEVCICIYVEGMYIGTYMYQIIHYFDFSRISE